jgi:hypothetical protein
MGNSQPIKNSQDNSRSTEKDTIGLDTFIEHVGPRKITQYDNEVSQLTSMLEPKNKNCVITIFPKELVVVEISDTDILSSADATSSVLPLATSKALSSTSSEFLQSPIKAEQSLIKPEQSLIKPEQSLIKPEQSPIKPGQPLIKSSPFETESSSPLIDTELIKKIRDGHQHGGAKKHKGIYIRSEDDEEEIVVDDDFEDDDNFEDDDDFEDDDEDKDDDIAEDIPRRNPKPVQHKSKKSPFMKHNESEKSESSSLKGKRNLKKNYIDYTSSESTLNKYSVSPVHTSDIQMYSEN